MDSPQDASISEYFLVFHLQSFKVAVCLFFHKALMHDHDSSGIASCLHYSVIQRTESAGWLMQCFVLFVLLDKHLAESSF